MITSHFWHFRSCFEFSKFKNIHLTLSTYLILLLSTTGYSQNIRGIIGDSIEHVQISNAVITVTRLEDSILIKFTRSDVRGFFQILELPPDSYLFTVSYSGYADFVDTFSINSGSLSPVIFNINLIPKLALLDSVIVMGKVRAVRVRGDTLEFNAESFHASPNSSVEDLIKLLPGVQVDREGKITVNGQLIERVLVDGEEFFGDDPTLVTRNLRADMVDKLQVFDRKTKKAIFTGVPDGESTKTLNVKLKEDKKHGWFSKIIAGFGTSSLYNNQIMYNRFSGSEKVSIYGLWLNNGEVGLNSGDRSTYANGADVEYEDENIIELDTWAGDYAGKGLPDFKGAGVHYSNKWNKSRHSIVLSGKTTDMKLKGENSLSSKYLLPDTTYLYKQKDSFQNRSSLNSLNVQFESQIDSMTTMDISLGGRIFNKQSRYNIYSKTSNATDSLLNFRTQSILTDEKNRSLAGTALVMRKFMKLGRSLSADLKFSDSHLNTEGSFKTLTNVSDASSSGGFINDTTDQHKFGEGHHYSWKSELTYTEPVSLASTFIFQYDVGANRGDNVLDAFNPSSVEKYDLYDSAYSVDYQIKTQRHKVGIFYRYYSEQIQYSFGNSVGKATISQDNYLSSISFDRQFTIWSPQAEFKYSPNGIKSFTVTYNGNTALPGIQQITPLRNNNDPLNVSIGNPLLKPSFSNMFRLLFINMDPLSQKTTWFDISYSNIYNSVGTSDIIDSTGKRTYRFANLGSTYFFKGILNYSFPIKEGKFNLGVIGSWNLLKSPNQINFVSNENTNGNYSLGVFVGRNMRKNYAFSISNNIFYNRNRSTIGESPDADFWSNNLKIFAEANMPYGVTFQTNFSGIVRQNTSTFSNNGNVFLWDAAIGKAILRDKSLVLKLSMKDILNQNKGVIRSSSANYINESSYTVLKRYFLLTCTMNFNKFRSN